MCSVVYVIDSQEIQSVRLTCCLLQNRLLTDRAQLCQLRQLFEKRAVVLKSSGHLTSGPSVLLSVLSDCQIFIV